MKRNPNIEGPAQHEHYKQMHKTQPPRLEGVVKNARQKTPRKPKKS